MMYQTSAVIFDAGGTLVHPDWLRIGQIVESETHKAFPLSEIAAKGYEVIKSVDAELQKSDSLCSRSNELNWLFLETFSALGVSLIHRDRLRERLCAEHERMHLWSTLDSDAMLVLNQLKSAGQRIAVISNTEDGRLKESLTSAGIVDYFDLLIDSQLVGLRKPDPAIFFLALSHLNLAPSEVAYIGDSYRHDVVPAESIGMKAVLLDRYNLHEDLTCTTITSLREVVSRVL